MKKAIVILAGLALAGCGQEAPAGNSSDAPPPPPPSLDVEPAETGSTQLQISSDAPRVTTAVKNTIDWGAAREDLSANTDGVVQIQSANEPPAEVPVLLPTGITISQSADAGPVYRNTPDGYFAFYPGAVYNIVMNGTNQVVDTDVMASQNPDKAPVFSETIGGAEVWLSRYGATYFVEFECTATEAEGETCITQEEAMKVVDELIVARSR